MSRAFTREDDNEAIADIGERPVSTFRNLVTEHGLRKIEKLLAELHEELAQAERRGERERIATISRDLRYWTARRENAELSVPEADSAVVRFGMRVKLEAEDGTHRSWTIVGEDEAEASKGTISHASPMAQALFGKAVGEVVSVAGKEWQIAALAVPAPDEDLR
jgi:transcription elongation GreA/GreB family factor